MNIRLSIGRYRSGYVHGHKALLLQHALGQVPAEGGECALGVREGVLEVGKHQPEEHVDDVVLVNREVLRDCGCVLFEFECTYMDK